MTDNKIYSISHNYNIQMYRWINSSRL